MSVQSDVSTPRLDREADEKRVVVVDVNSETKSSAAAEVDSSGARLTGGAVCAKKDVADATDSVERSQNIGHSLLSDKAILEHMRRGTVVIRPFVRANLATSSYDVTLGTSYYRETPPESGSSTLYNPFSQAMVERVWGHICTAERADEWTARAAVAPLDNIAVDDRIIVLAPGETILAHTNEFIGGRGSVCQMMKARSSLGRNFIEVCKCAGWGDIGYVNRWTMEITNNSRYYSVPLVVGRRIAQIIFFDTCGTVDNASYADSGKYQSTTDLEILMRTWTPAACLPKLYLDREIKQSSARSYTDDTNVATETPLSRTSLEKSDAFDAASSTQRVYLPIIPNVYPKARRLYQLWLLVSTCLLVCGALLYGHLRENNPLLWVPFCALMCVLIVIHGSIYEALAAPTPI